MWGLLVNTITSTFAQLCCVEMPHMNTGTPLDSPDLILHLMTFSHFSRYKFLQCMMRTMSGSSEMFLVWANLALLGHFRTTVVFLSWLSMNSQTRGKGWVGHGGTFYYELGITTSQCEFGQPWHDGSGLVMQVAEHCIRIPLDNQIEEQEVNSTTEKCQSTTCM